MLLLLQGVQNDSVGSPRLMYSLYGVVEHSGTLRSGHYTAYVKLRSSDTSISHCLQFLQSLAPSRMSVDQLVAKLRSISVNSGGHQHPQHRDDSESKSSGHGLPAPDGRWFHISDTSVSQVKLANVLHCQAYILFYERIA